MFESRPLSKLEKIFWRLSDASSLNFTMVCRWRGPLPESVLRAAIDAVQQLHPFLQIRIEVTPAGPVFQPGDVPQLPLQIIDRSDLDHASDSEAIKEIIEEELVHSVGWERGPLVRCTLIRHSDQVQHFLFTFHHVIGDGVSGIVFLRDVLEAIAANGEKATPAASNKQQQLQLPTAVDCRYPQEFKGWRGIWKSVKTILSFRREDRRIGPVVKLPCDSGAEPDSHRTHVLIRPFDTQFTSLLKERAKEHKTTVHCVMSAVLALTAAEELGAGEPVSIKHRSPINIRHKLDPRAKEELGLYVSLMFYRDRLTGTEDLWDIARRIQLQHQQARAQQLPLVLLRLMATLYRAVGGDKISNAELASKWRAKSPGTTGLTNLGRVDLPTRVGPLEIEAFHASVSPSALIDFTSTATTYNGQLTWTFICPCRVFEKKHAEQFVEKIVERIQQNVQS